MENADKVAPGEEEILIRKAAKGSLDAFNQLVLCYQNLAYRQAYALLGDAAAADDITQEGFIKAYLNLHSFRGGSFRAWLLKIVTNLAFDQLRKTRTHPVQSLYPEDEYGEEIESPAWFTDPSLPVETIVERKEESKRLHQIMDDLPEKYRSILTLVDLYEMEYWEAAEILQIPLGTVKSRLARARVQISKKLHQDLEFFTTLNQAVPLTPA